MSEHPPEQGSPAALKSKTALVMSLAALMGLAVNLTPLEALHWAPEDPMAFLPRLLRPAEEVDPGPAIEGQVDDEALLAMAPEPEPKPDPGEQSIVPPEQALIGAPTDAELAEEEEIGAVVASDAALPPGPPVRRKKGRLPRLAIEDPQGAMARFYKALDKVAAEDFGAKARVLHYGDSLIAGDYVTQTVRRLLQKKFGDGGHGFVFAGMPSRWYHRDNLRLRASKKWKIHRLTKPTIRDGAYGLGGATFRTHKAGQWVKFTPVGKELGSTVGQMQVFYLGQPGGGKFELEVDGRGVTVDTKTPDKASRKAEITVNDAPHTLQIRTKGGGEVRLFGAVLETDRPGVVYDSLGLEGTRAKLLKRMDPPHWHDQIRLRQPDLLILHYGTNESQWANLSARRYRADLAQTVGHLRQALPGVSCLLVGPLDRAHSVKGKLKTRPVVKRIVGVQRRVAYDQGCAFWNTWRAMGGEGSMARWYKHRPQLAAGDLTHPTRLGADRIGAMLFTALYEGYTRHREEESGRD